MASSITGAFINHMLSNQSNGIIAPHSNDVLSGRGNFVNYHEGNRNFRAIVKKYKEDYVACAKSHKPKFAKLVVDQIQSLDPPGRFLKQDSVTKLWYDIGKKKALEKTRQALREGAPKIIQKLTDKPSKNIRNNQMTIKPEASLRTNSSAAIEDIVKDNFSFLYDSNLENQNIDLVSTIKKYCSSSNRSLKDVGSFVDMSAVFDDDDSFWNDSTPGSRRRKFAMTKAEPSLLGTNNELNIQNLMRTSLFGDYDSQC